MPDPNNIRVVNGFVWQVVSSNSTQIERIYKSEDVIAAGGDPNVLRTMFTIVNKRTK
jgi:hypothetical protein